MSQSKLGILMLDTIFHRPIGDIGNPETFTFPVEFEVVEKATIERVMKKSDSSLIEPFIQAAKRLERNGVKAITTSCGFLALFQQDIQRQLKIPFFSSSLMQIPMVHHLTGGTVGVLTARKESLTHKHLQGVNAQHTPIVMAGMDHMPAFTKAIVDETHALDMEAVSLEMKQVTFSLLEDRPDIRAIVLECTNMPPYRDALREATHLPVFDITTLANYVYRSFD
ncbi:aspartate/glutamate racemase family protein [Virgibacillus sp. C22-A2]|uniref:Aspartate/glutamate racemase family protein n=1 Tax=Virgibacillus tibetensis TaxID=3042313 RepID=A0ABU6KLD3_9BACI|nr:aspartate/glutamate racemase family protein [Virgibacillus sp. C22-A2]